MTQESFGINGNRKGETEMEITIKVHLDGENLDTAACSANAARLGVAITQLRTLQETWKTVAKRLKGDGGHKRT